MPFEDNLTVVFGALVVSALLILVCGIRITSLADRIADRSGLGEALVGGVLLGAATSLSGSIVSITSALDGRASLAFSNGIGGIAAQTAFLAIADLTYKRANLEHASAELTNVFQCAVLMLLLSLPFLAFNSPDFAVFGVHPVSLAIPVIYAMSLMGTKRLRDRPMWHPEPTEETRADSPEDDDGSAMTNWGLGLRFVGLMVILGTSGWVIARSGAVLSDRLGLSETLVGALMTATITSLPELVTTLAAVRRHALQLAVGGIIGGNTFDTLFLTLSDVSYRDGSLYHAVSASDYFWNGVGLTMTAVLMIGLLYREQEGTAKIGFESIGTLGLFGGAIVLQALWG